MLQSLHPLQEKLSGGCKAALAIRNLPGREGGQYIKQNLPGDYTVVAPERNYWGDGEHKCLRASFLVGWAPGVSLSPSAMHSLAQVYGSLPWLLKHLA